MPENISFDEQEQQTEQVQEQQTEQVQEKDEEISAEQQIEDGVRAYNDEDLEIKDIEIPEGSLHGKTDGSEEVEMDGPTQDRFNRIYRQMKTAKDDVSRQERDIELMREHNQRLEERLNKREQEQANLQRDQNIANLEQQYSQALEEGDNAKAASINRQMIQEQTKVHEQPETTVPSKAEKPVSDVDAQYLTHWQNEVAEDGYFERPWIQPNHPKFNYSRQLIQTVYAYPGWEGATLQQVLTRVDEIMDAESTQNINTNQQQAPQAQTQAQAQPKQVAAVSTSDTSYRPEANRTGSKSLTSEEKRVARMIMPDIEPQQAYERYAAEKED